MARTRKLTVEVAGETKGLRSAFRNAEDSAGRLGDRVGRVGGVFQGLTKTATLALGGIAIAGVALGKSFVDAAVESQKVTKQTAAVIKSMGGASKVTAGQVAKLSQKLALKTGVDDELIQSGQNLLLTFGKVRNEVGKGNKIFDRATELTLDMSVAMGTDMKSASIQVGKALNDPIKGITALTRVGVSFTAQQKEQIKALVKSGDTLAAQKIILGELEKQFGGSAAAQATAADKLKVAWGNVQEELGAVLLPILESVASWLAERLPGAIETLKTWIDGTLKPALEDVKTWFEEHVKGPMSTVVEFVKETLLPRLGEFITWIKNSEPAMLVLAGIVGTVLVGAMLSYAASALIAAGATIAATWPVWLAVAAIAAFIAILYQLTHGEGEGFITWLFRMGVMVYAAGRSIWGLAQTIWSWATTAYNAIRKIIDALRDLKDALTSVPGGGLLGNIAGGVNGLVNLLPARAMGGPVFGGSPYLVGEQGPELFVPGSSGSIVPNHAMGNSYQINVTAGPTSDPGSVGQAVVEAITAFERRNGASWRR